MFEEELDADTGPLLHDPPCLSCGHAAHTYLECGDGCDCQPTPMPGAERALAGAVRS